VLAAAAFADLLAAADASVLPAADAARGPARSVFAVIIVTSVP